MQKGKLLIGFEFSALLSSVIFSFIPLTIDFSLPGLSALQRDMGTEHIRAELTLTVAFLGLALSQLVFGSIADRLGRRWPLLLSMCVYSAASLCAGLSNEIGVFAVARLIQSIAFGVALVVARAMVVDVCNEIATARAFSIGIAAMSLTGVVAPAIGGQLVAHFGWRSLFVTMAVVGAFSSAAIAKLLPETLPGERRSSVKFREVKRVYSELLKNPRFSIPAIAGGSIISCQFTYNTGTPSIFIEHFSLSTAACGLALSLITLGLALASFFNTVLLKWFTPEAVVRRAVWVSVASAVVLTVLVFYGIGGAVAIIVSLFVLATTVAFTAASTMASAISSAGTQVGAASALLGFIQLAIGAVASALVGFFHDSTGRPMGITILVLTLLALYLLSRAPVADVQAMQPESVRPKARA
jgi:DHA1 family bicyclomycin/chloramphenicol resistance-like MFS transporter